MTILKRTTASDEAETSSSYTIVEDNASSDEPPPKTYPQAWMGLFFLVMLRTSVSVFQCTYTVVPTITGEFFGVSLSAVNWLSNIQGLVYVALSFITGWIFEQLGVKRSFASTWFTENMRATAGMFSLIILIMAVGTLIPLIFMPAKPPRPPVPEHILQVAQNITFFKGLRMIVKNYHFWFLFLIHGLNIGLAIGFGTVFTQIVNPHGYTNAQAGLVNAVGFFAGTLGCSIAGPVLDATKQHKLFLRLVSPMVFVSYLGFMFIRKDPPPLLLKKNTRGLKKSFLVHLISYPIPEAISSSLIWQGCQIFGFISVLVMDTLRDSKGDMYRALIFQVVLAGIMVVLSFTFHGPMVRQQAIASRQDQKEKVVHYDHTLEKA
ncbi:MFS general substrate transporter [Hesseltinella vesiculosa]|uniref:MFS general substrate transporter n=1 Tax=Hesseltinella vesiculosa TaxID=101127 RepID=A0A1X2GPX3_9FUNG|nr:MFS general substrate transporter [Hesseltinella vesiculosa]